MIAIVVGIVARAPLELDLSEVVLEVLDVAMYLTGTVPVPLETRSIVVVVIVAGIVVAAIVGGILWMRPPPVAVDVDLVGGLVFGGVFAPANFRLLIAL